MRDPYTFLRHLRNLREEEEFLAETAEIADSGDWLTQINSIIKIICGICAICERIGGFSQKPRKSQKKIINLNNQINLSEPHIPFCAVCAICERKRSFSQKSRNPQIQVIGSHRLIGFLRFSAPYAVEEEFLAETAEIAEENNKSAASAQSARDLCGV